MAEIVEQLSARDAALLTWGGFGLLLVAWSLIRGGEVGKSIVAVVRSALAPRLLAMLLLVTGWQLVVIYAAARVGLWNVSILKDTVVLVAVGSVVCGFRALALMKGEETWRSQVRALITLVVVIQFVSNLETFPYLVELLLVPIAVLLGGVQALANHDDDHAAARPLINGIVTTLGLTVFGWSVYRLATSLSASEWDTVGRQFALAFWLPTVLLPAIYLAALVMQYGMTFTIMKIVQPQSVSARAQVLAHYRLNLRRLNGFARDRGRVREYARTTDKGERTALLKGFAHSANR